MVDRFPTPTDTEKRLLKAGVVPLSWSFAQARNWLWRHGMSLTNLCREGTKRGERKLRAYAAWRDVLDPNETPSMYKRIAYVPGGGKLSNKAGRPFPKPPNPHQLGTPRELSLEEMDHKASRKLRLITRAFGEVPITAKDLNALLALPSPFKGTPRLYPCGRMWRPCEGAPDAQELPPPQTMFKARPTIEPRFLASICGRVLQWLAMNPHATPSQIAEAMGTTTSEVNRYIARLRKRGLIIKAEVWTICPSLIGEDRMFKYK